VFSEDKVKSKLIKRKEQINKIKDKINTQNKELEIDEIIKNEQDIIKKDIAIVHKMDDEEKAYWIIDKHNEFINAINFTIEQDFLNGDNPFSRYLIITYMHQLTNLLSTYEIEFTAKMVNILVKENCVELLSILNVLNYV